MYYDEISNKKRTYVTHTHTRNLYKKKNLFGILYKLPRFWYNVKYMEQEKNIYSHWTKDGKTFDRKKKKNLYNFSHNPILGEKALNN